MIILAGRGSGSGTGGNPRGRDLQNVAATGVGDSMQDMIVCMIGTLAALPAAAQLAGGKSGLLSGAVRTFAEKNLWENPK